MGGEILIPLAVFGVVLGLAGAITVLVRSRSSRARTVLLAGVTFLVGLILPIGLFLSYGSYIRTTSPKIEIPSPNSR